METVQTGLWHFKTQNHDETQKCISWDENMSDLL